MSKCIDEKILKLFYNEIYGTKNKVDVSSSILKSYKKEFKILEKQCRVTLA